jgi:hypothetical protein
MAVKTEHATVLVNIAGIAVLTDIADIAGIEGIEDIAVSGDEC